MPDRYTHAMNTRELCLGALHLCDASGYEIKQLFEQAYRHFQKVSYGSIYPALKKLLDEGLVTYRSETGDGKPTKKVYTLTGAGVEAFAHTLNKTQPTEQYQSNFQLLILFSRFLSPQRMEEVLDQYTEQVLAERKELSSLTSPECIKCLTPEALMTIQYGKSMVDAQLQFLQEHRLQWQEQHRERHQQVSKLQQEELRRIEK